MSGRCLIKLLGADGRLTAGIALLFKTFGKNGYELSDNGTLVLIDGDSVEGKSALKEGMKPNYIVMTVTPGQYADAFIIEKPIKSQNLIDILAKAQKHVETLAPASEVSDVKPSYENAGNPFAKFHSKDYQASIAKQQQEKRAQQTAQAAALATSNAQVAAKEVPSKPQASIKAASNSKPLPETKADAKKVIPAPEVVSHTVDEGRIHDIAQPAEESVAVKETLGHTLFQGIRSIAFDHTKMSDPVKYCGIAQDIDLTDSVERSHVHFNEKNYLCGHLIKAKKEAQQTDMIAVLELDKDYIFLSIKEDKIYTSLPETSLYAIALMPIDQSLSIKYTTNTNELFQIAKEHNVSYYGNLHSMLSRITLWSSRGRLFQDEDIYEALGMKQRTLALPVDIAIPHMKEIDDLWCSRSVSLFETTEELSVAQRYIFSYYCVCRVYEAFVAGDSVIDDVLEETSFAGIDDFADEVSVLEGSLADEFAADNDLETLLAELKRL